MRGRYSDNISRRKKSVGHIHWMKQVAIKLCIAIGFLISIPTVLNLRMLVNLSLLANENESLEEMEVAGINTSNKTAVAVKSNKFLPCCQPDKVRCEWIKKGGIIPPCEKGNLLLLLKWLKNVLGNDIVWYITAGTLLGATRNESHIPHETDIDVNIITKHLGNAHKLIEAHIGRTHFVLAKKTVPNRLFFSPKNQVHVDIWPMICEKDTSKEIQPIKNKGLFRYDVNSTWLFPLKKCKYEGLLYPCPRENKLWTMTRYGSDWTIPKAKYSNRPEYMDGDGQGFTGLTRVNETTNRLINEANNSRLEPP